MTINKNTGMLLNHATKCMFLYEPRINIIDTREAIVTACHFNINFVILYEEDVQQRHNIYIVLTGVINYIQTNECANRVLLVHDNTLTHVHDNPLTPVPDSNLTHVMITHWPLCMITTWCNNECLLINLTSAGKHMLPVQQFWKQSV